MSETVFPIHTHHIIINYKNLFLKQRITNISLSLTQFLKIIKLIWQISNNNIFQTKQGHTTK